MQKITENGKRPGIDLIQAEVCKNQIFIYVLHKLFNVCFKTGKVPNMWNRGIITPIPKCSTSDPRNPLSYRGITLAPFAYKVLCGILNDLSCNESIHRPIQPAQYFF